MTEFASGQQSIAQTVNAAYPGDYYGIPGIAGSSTAGTGFVAASNITVGVFAWVVEGLTGNYTGTQLTQAQGSNSRYVFIPRTNANTYANADLFQGWSMTVPANYQIEGCVNGTFYSYISASFNSGGVINVGDAIYINTTDGTLAVGVLSGQTGYAQTNYVVTNNAVINSYVLNMVVISNVGGI